MMNKETIISNIKESVRQRGEVVFAFIFGSFVKNRVFRDIDIAIYSEPELNLIHFGMIQSEIAESTGQKIDLVPLNGLPGKNPAFAYEIVTHGHLIFSADNEKLTDYKRKALLYYFDTEKLRKDTDRAFSSRVESGKFGQRNYA